MAVLSLAGCATGPRRAEPEPAPSGPVLESVSILPAETFTVGPPSGAQLKPPQHGSPWSSQPVQGFSGLISEGDHFLTLSDNGYGIAANSGDFLLRVSQLDLADGGALRATTRFLLSDPNRSVDFDIVNGGTPTRVLTGADFDPESFVRAPDGTFWFGEEFGPFLLHTDAAGRLLEAPYALPDGDGGFLRSPDAPALRGRSDAGVPAVKRSSGFENLAITPDGATLYAMLEKPLGDSRELLAFSFDLRQRTFGPLAFRFGLDPRAVAVGDIALLDARHGVALERDDSDGRADGYKRLIRFTLPAHAGGLVERAELADLVRLPRADGGRFAFSFWCIEGVASLPDGRVAIVNDNNYPFGRARHPDSGVPDDSELIIVRLPRL